MSTRLFSEIANLKRVILALGAMAEAAVRDAARAIENRDEHLARNVIHNDARLDDMEIRIEEDCFKTLALHQPVASDLRFVIAVLKINNDLERVGDLAVNIAEHAAFLATEDPVGISCDLRAMARKAQEMLRRSLDSLVNRSVEQAREVLASDDEVDTMDRRMHRLVRQALDTRSDQMESLIHMLSASQDLERIADHATNIGEEVIYMIEGETVRHRAEDRLCDHAPDQAPATDTRADGDSASKPGVPAHGRTVLPDTLF